MIDLSQGGAHFYVSERPIEETKSASILSTQKNALNNKETKV